MKFCSECGATLNILTPEDDHRPRHVCPECSTIHYLNPRIIAGTLPVYRGKLMLCKRGIEPRKHYWTIPGGFMEMDESLEEGALRETWEEACTRVVSRQLLSVISLPVVDQVHCFFLADMETDDYQTTPESLEIIMVEPEQIPWDDIAFETVSATLRHYCEHRHEQDIPVLTTTLGPRPPSGEIR